MKSIKVFFTLLFIILIGVSFQNCGKSNSNSVNVSWNMTLDGQSYSAEELFAEGQDINECVSIFQTNSGTSGAGGQIVLSDQGMITITIQDVNLTNTGTYNFDDMSDGAFTIMNGMSNYSTFNGGSVSVNVTSFASQTLGAHTDLQSTLCIGDFSGTIADFNGNLHNVSGSFQSVRAQ